MRDGYKALGAVSPIAHKRNKQALHDHDIAARLLHATCATTQEYAANQPVQDGASRFALALVRFPASWDADDDAREATAAMRRAMVRTCMKRS